jgi:hypothetical protein
MKIFIIVRDDITVANGVVFAPGAVVVHSLLRRDRDSVTRFPGLAEVRQAYSGCKLVSVETSREATYSYVVRRTRDQAQVKRKTAPKKKAKGRKRA